MSERRATPEVRCVKCAGQDAYERRSMPFPGRAPLWQFYCPDCGAQFYVEDMPKECDDCKRPLRSMEDRGRGLCPSCRVARWSPEKRGAINQIIGMAFKDPAPTDAEKDAAIDEAFKHLD